jgi:hypothetical protein
MLSPNFTNTLLPNKRSGQGKANTQKEKHPPVLLSFCPFLCEQYLKVLYLLTWIYRKTGFPPEDKILKNLEIGRNSDDDLSREHAINWQVLRLLRDIRDIRFLRDLRVLRLLR